MPEGRERPSPSPAGTAADAGQAPAGGLSDGAQHYGPLVLDRQTKEDGRALILFSVAPGSSEPSR